MGRTNIVMDDELIAECQRISGIATKREMVHRALLEYLRLQRQKGVAKLKGRIHWEGDLDEWRRKRPE